MTDLPTLEVAMKLADQDSPLPSLAGPALKVLREHILRVRNEEDYLTRLAKEFGTVKWFERHGVPDTAQDSATLTALIAELRAREAVGRAKYGTDVDRTDLTNPQWRQHLREELMDALLYSLAEERTRPMEVVECGGCAPAVAASPVYGVDHGVDDRTVEMFGHHDAGGVLHIEDIVESEPNNPNSGHGHVRWRPDGVVAKCGGPMLCRICAKELADMFEVPGANKCWCGTCHPIAINNIRMVLCPTCGNKRCPHAHDHRNACTHSNAVGQPGSSWEHVKPIGSQDPGESS